MDSGSSPAAFYGAELRRARELAGMTQDQLAAKTGYSQAQIAKVENAQRIPSRDFAERADTALGTDGILARLQGLVEQTSVLPGFRDRVEAERGATEIREYASYQIPGLLQTREYARAMIAVARPMFGADDAERAVALRMARQEILEPSADLPIDQEHTPRLWAIIDESALNRVVGSPEIMVRQRQRLAAWALIPTVTIQVIADSDSPTCANGREFTIITTAGSDPVVYLEDVGSARYVRDRGEVARYVVAFDHLRGCAQNDSRSLVMLRGVTQMEWKKSSFSGSQGGNCVEVAQTKDGGRMVRDSKNPAGPALTFTGPEWDAFVSGAKAGEFDAV